MKQTNILFRRALTFIAFSTLFFACKKEEKQPEIAGKTVLEVISSDSKFSILNKALDRLPELRSRLSSKTTGTTIFVPDNEAFAASNINDAIISSLPIASLDSILKYHLLDGRFVSGSLFGSPSVKTILGKLAFPTKPNNELFINLKKIKTADLIASNGVVHVISGVLMPPNKISEIVDVDPQFSILKAALVKANLLGALSQDNLTVFAPDNEAFAASNISEGTINSLPKAALDSILKYHVLGTPLLSTSVPTSVTGVNTLLNINLFAVRNQDSSVMVNDAKVKKADIIASNGIVHIISKVLMPATIKDIVVLDPNFSILKAAVVRAGLADAVATGSLTVFAPDNAAFAASGIDEAAVNSFTIQELTNILLYHVVGAKVPSSGVPVSDTVKTLLGKNLYASKNTNGVFMNGIAVKAADVQAANGVIHVVSKVLIPPTKTIAEIVSADSDLSLLFAAVVRAGLAGVVSGSGKFTVFAPTNAAFIAAGFPDAAAIDTASVDAVASIVKAHVFGTNVFASDLSEGAKVETLETGKSLVFGTTPPSVKIDGSANPASNIILSDVNITATNGVIHKIDKVLQ